MSAVIQDDLNNLTNDQLRSRLLQYGLGNMPVTDSTRRVLLAKLRRTIEGQTTASRRETVHVTKFPTDEEKGAAKPAPTSKKTTARRNTINPTPMVQEDIVPIVPRPKNIRRSGRITPTLIGTSNSVPSIAVAPSEENIIELDEDSIREPYVPPKRTSRSPSLGKSQTVVTSYKTEVAKPIVIEESDEEKDDDEEDSEDQTSGSNGQNNIYPTLPTNGFKNRSPTKLSSMQSTLRRTTTHTASYQPRYEQNYREFIAPQPKPMPSTYSSSSSGVNRRYTTSSLRKYDDDSATEHSDIDAPYLSDFTKRLSQLRPEPLDRKIIADVKQQHLGGTTSSLWQSFSNLVIAFGRKFGGIILAGGLLMIVVFIYVFFIMA